MKKILILTPFTFTRRDYRRFGLDILKRNFFVKILDFSPWFYPNYHKEFINEIFTGEEYISIKKENDFLSLNLINEKFIIFDLLDTNKKSYWVRNKLKNKNSIFLTFNLNPIPKAEIPKYTLIKKYINFLPQPKVFFMSLFNLFLNKFYNNKTTYVPDISVVAGLEPLANLKSKKKLYAHSMDYDIYLKIKEKETSTNKVPPYAVFIDQDFITHPDMKIFNYDRPVSENKYYPALINFFKNFKIKTGLDIKFAVHPKSRNKKLKELLKEIDYSFGNTEELIKNSSLVLLHSSTAISFAVLFKKPIIILTSDELKKSWLWPRIKVLSKYTDTKPINIDKDLESQLNLENIFNFDKEKYSKYLNQYLKVPDSPDIPLWEIVGNYLKSY